MSEKALTQVELTDLARKRREEFDIHQQLDKVHLEGKWLDNDTRLSIRSWSSLTVTIAIKVTARVLRLHGGIDEYTFYLASVSTRVSQQTNYNLGVGYLLSVRIVDQNASFFHGQFFVNARLYNVVQAVDIEELCHGYVTAQEVVYWPAGRDQFIFSGHGADNPRIGTNPAAGVEISETIPTNSIALLKSFQFQLVTGAVAATRRVVIVIDDGTNELYRFDSQSTQIISLTRNYRCAGYKLQPADNGTYIYVAIPFPIFVTEGYRIRTITENLDPLDNYGAPIYQLEEWIDE